jgi:hypothetical protein
MASFNADFLANFSLFSPDKVEEGRFNRRSLSAIVHECRSMKTDVQSFN